MKEPRGGGGTGVESVLTKYENTIWRGCRDGSVVNSTECSSRECGFNSQNLHGNSCLAKTPVPGYLTPSHQCTENKFKQRKETTIMKILRFILVLKQSVTIQPLQSWSNLCIQAILELRDLCASASQILKLKLRPHPELFFSNSLIPTRLSVC